MDEHERERLQQLVDAAHQTAAALIRATSGARPSWTGAAGPGWGPAPAPGGGTFTGIGANAITEARMYGYGATGWPAFLGGGFGYSTLGPSPFTGFIPYAGPAYGVGLTHSGPGSTFPPGILGNPILGNPILGNPFLGSPAIPAASLLALGLRPFGLAHAGPEQLLHGNPLLGLAPPPFAPAYAPAIPGLTSPATFVAPAWSPGAIG